MAKKYKISEGNLDKFWDLFRSKKTPNKLQTVIDNDPVLKKLQDEIDSINDKAEDYLEKVKKRNPDIYQFLQNSGLIK